ncbi:MAG: hypothetical protein IJZ42_13450 [Lachnospiraceae bacterium]|nr:hypothetical protein [Lachnospiraceae bacterium]
MKIDDVFERKVIEKFDIKPEVKKLNKKQLLDLLNRLFREEYQGKTVSFAMLERELFVKTTAKTRLHFGFRNNKASFKGHKIKLLLGASGEYLSLISNLQYSHSEKDKKPDQSSIHRNTKGWHYFTKMILCENTYYQVMVDVNESKSNELTVYNVSLKPCKEGLVFEAEHGNENKKEGSMHSAPKLTDLRDGTSSDDIIAEEKGNVNRNYKKYSKNYKNNFKKPSLDAQMKSAENRKHDQKQQNIKPMARE